MWVEHLRFLYTSSSPTVHGNAAHLGSAQRPEIYRTVLGLSTPSNPVHVFALDYRGFGVSTGSPTEEGIITDAVSLLNFLTAGPLRIPPSRIVLMGQSLGTAVTAAVAERFAFGSPDPAAVQPAIKDPEPFAGVILLASFSNIPSLIESYSFKGMTPPMLRPLMGYPRVQNWVLSHIVDHWDTAARVARLTGVGPTAENDSKSGYGSKELDLSIIHALDDVEIPWYEGRRVWAAAIGEKQEGAPGSLVYEHKEVKGPGEVRTWENKSPSDPNVVKRVRWERVGYGGMYRGFEPLIVLLTLFFSFAGHNRVATFSVTALAILRAFER
jgi:pimeloyl-ACP methyl ester carboxylesterase